MTERLVCEVPVSYKQKLGILKAKLKKDFKELNIEAMNLLFKQYEKELN